MIDVDGGHQPDRSDAARAPWNPCNAGQPQTQNLSLMEAVRLQFALRLLSVETRRIRLGPPASDIWGSELRTLQWPLRNTGTVHISKRQYPPNQLQAVQVLRSSFCSSWLRRLQVDGWGRDKPCTAGRCAAGVLMAAQSGFQVPLADEYSAKRQPRICLGRPSRSPILPVGGTGRCDANCNRPASIASPYLPNSSITRR